MRNITMGLGLIMLIAFVGCATGQIQIKDKLEEFNSGVVIAQDIPFLITKLNHQHTVELTSTVEQGCVIMKNLPPVTKLDLISQKDAKGILLKVTVYEKTENDAIVTFEKNELKVTTKSGSPVAIKEIIGIFPEQAIELDIDIDDVAGVKGELFGFEIKGHQQNAINIK